MSVRQDPKNNNKKEKQKTDLLLASAVWGVQVPSFSISWPSGYPRLYIYIYIRSYSIVVLGVKG